MTVRELIMALSKFPEKAQVNIEMYDDIDDVISLFEEEDVVYLSNAEDIEDNEPDYFGEY